MRYILTLVSLFIAGFSFSQVVNLNGGSSNDTISSYTDLTVTGTLTVTGEINYSPPHGSFAFHDSSVTLDMSTGNWATVTNPTNNLFITVDADDMVFAGDSLTIEDDGDYITDVSLSFSGTSSDNYEISFFKNSVLIDRSMERSTSQTDVGNVSLPLYLENLVAGDDITFRIRNTASNDDATLISCSWLIWLLHPD